MSKVDAVVLCASDAAAGSRWPNIGLLASLLLLDARVAGCRPAGAATVRHFGGMNSTRMIPIKVATHTEPNTTTNTAITDRHEIMTRRRKPPS
jgi:hypothetical protein